MNPMLAATRTRVILAFGAESLRASCVSGLQWGDGAMVKSVGVAGVGYAQGTTPDKRRPGLISWREPRAFHAQT